MEGEIISNIYVELYWDGYFSIKGNNLNKFIIIKRYNNLDWFIFNIGLGLCLICVLWVCSDFVIGFSKFRFLDYFNKEK